MIGGERVETRKGWEFGFLEVEGWEFLDDELIRDLIIEVWNVMFVSGGESGCFGQAEPGGPEGDKNDKRG